MIRARTDPRRGSADLDGTPVAELPHSAKAVFLTLYYEGPMTQRQVAEQSGVPQRTVRYAAKELLQAGAITADPNIPDDAREVAYDIAPEWDSRPNGDGGEAD